MFKATNTQHTQHTNTQHTNTQHTNTNTQHTQHTQHTNTQRTQHTQHTQHTKKPYQDKSAELEIQKEIKKGWIDKFDTISTTESVNFYESKKQAWLDGNSKYLLKKLTKKQNVEILDYVLVSMDQYTSSKGENKNRGYSLLNENVWEVENFDKTIEIFNLLISHGYNFFELSTVGNEGSGKLEIEKMLYNIHGFYISIVRRDKKIPKQLQEDLYQLLNGKLKLTTIDKFKEEINKNSKIINDIKTLVNRYFSNENQFKVRLESSESFLGALVNKDNKIDPLLCEQLYQYFTNNFYDKEHFVSCLRLMFNKITDSNHKLFIDSMLFILSRNVNEMSYEIFKLLVFRESVNITEKTIIKSLLSHPTGKADFVKYFDTIDISSVGSNLIFNILTNFEDWIVEIVNTQILINPQVNPDEFRINDIGVVFMILGIAYSKGLHQSFILDKLSQIMKSSLNLIKPFGVFFDNANIDINKLESSEHTLLVKYIQKYYLGNGMKEKMIIENIIENLLYRFSTGTSSKATEIREKQINMFLTKGYFLIPSKPKHSISTQSNSKLNHKHTFACLAEEEEEEEEADEEAEEEEEEAEEEAKEEAEYFPEPNNKVMTNIQIYFSSKDKQSALDDLTYFIEQNKITCDNFSYGLLYSLAERNQSEVPSIRELLNNLVNVEQFGSIQSKLSEMIIQYTSLIESFRCDNPRINDIISELA